MKKCCSKPNLNILGKVFKALGDRNRLAIFQHLCDCCHSGRQESNVKEISTCCDVDLSVVSRHLTHLKKAEILSSTKKGKEVLYSINGKKVAEELRKLADYIEHLDSPKE
ncbi:hypothetical protein A9Q84_18755 [Halobacteriovorax marinus]|uniref:HTH arsR-type domain-containing protein n=1 Tax=Halobacteriovorax marinus TaxID=97084 RepID=A0A1Y5F281_9BACT|nr:hypothetical protein A9Q84_18755 [Halobacteriovorax marinus]